MSETRTDGRYLPGQSGNPKGRPKGIRDVDEVIFDALQKAQARRATLKEVCSCVPKDQADLPDAWEQSCRDIDEHFARRAFQDDKILVAFQKKRIPDLQHQTGDTARVVNIIRMDRAHGTDRP